MKAGAVSRCLYRGIAECAAHAAPGWGQAEDEPHNVQFLCDPAMQELCSALFQGGLGSWSQTPASRMPQLLNIWFFPADYVKFGCCSNHINANFSHECKSSKLSISLKV